LAWPDRVVLAGHLDTVPPNGNAVPKIDGTTLWGLGSTDMKGGLAVMLDLAGSVRRPNCDVTYVFYVAEEIAREHNGLLALANAEPGLLDASAAIVCEPTNSRVEAGCQGVLKADVTMVGQRAHVARPWTGRNAIHRLAPLLESVARWPGRVVEMDGCTYTESLQAVGVSGGVASNVLPDRVVLQLNYRFAPDQDAAAAGEALGETIAPWLEAGDSFTVADSAPSAPSVAQPSVPRSPGKRCDRSGTGKLGWTDVAFFAERGIPAANFGPGDPELAHTAGEMITRTSLDEARAVLGRLLGE
jgi:succinyl-diaminopimelate desuccinylase